MHTLKFRWGNGCACSVDVVPECSKALWPVIIHHDVCKAVVENRNQTALVLQYVAHFHAVCVYCTCTAGMVPVGRQ